MLCIDPSSLQELRRHGEAAYPLESCGVLLGRARDGVRVLCEICQEEIINDRQVMRDGVVLCRACAGQPYYRQLREHETRVSLGVVPCLQNL